MHIRTSLSILALALAAPAVAQSGSVQDFRLPPDPDSTATPEVQGPVDPEAPVPTTPRVIPTETPTPRPTGQPSPVPTPTRAPLQIPAQPIPTPEPDAPAPSRRAPSGISQAPSGQPEGPAASAIPEAAPRQDVSPAMDGGLDLAPPPSVADAAPGLAGPEEDGGSLIPWLAALVLALAAAGAGFWYLRRREELVPVPIVEPPLARREPRPAPGAQPSPPQAAAVPLPRSPSPRAAEAGVSLAAQPVRFSRSVMAATFAYRVVLENRSGEQWEDLAIEADLVTAHGAAPIGEQLAEAGAPLAPMKTVATLGPGETVEIAGDVRLPLQQVRAIKQGSAAVYVPLLRLRLVAKGKSPVARTYLVGQLPDREGGKLQPFRLDEMPQSYHAIGIRALD